MLAWLWGVQGVVGYGLHYIAFFYVIQKGNAVTAGVSKVRNPKPKPKLKPKPKPKPKADPNPKPDPNLTPTPNPKP